MNIFQTIDELSYKKIISIALFLAILFGVPVGVVLVSNETRSTSKAAYEKPTPATQPLATPGPVPLESPQIGRVFPWVGKVGDIVWIQGKNFGTNPTEKRLTIGGIEIKPGDIAAWDDDLIQALIPAGAAQGGIVQVAVGTHPVSQSIPFVIYDNDATIKLHKKGNLITAEKAASVAKATIWTGDDEIALEQHETPVTTKATSVTPIFDTQGLPVLSIVLQDNRGYILPYYVDPIEWGF